MQIHLWPRPSGVLLALLTLTIPGNRALAESAVFRCVVNDVVTFYDRPCGDDAKTYEPDDARFSTVTAAPASKPAASPRAAKPKRIKSGSIAADQMKHADTCARIDRSLRDIRSKMRAGYDAKQGERLNERQRKLNQQRRDERC
jgi:hypothetical protein